MKQILTVNEIDSIISAIEIAEGESGGDYSDLKTKLLTIYPEAGMIRNERARIWQEESDKQTLARKEVANMIFTSLRNDKPILDQLKTLIHVNYNIIRAHYSDKVCLSADLFKYHLGGLVRMGLIKELRDYLEKEGEKPENYWMKDHYANEEMKELWHVLVKILDSVERS